MGIPCEISSRMAMESIVPVFFSVIFFCFNCDTFYYLFQYGHIPLSERIRPLSKIETAVDRIPLLFMYSYRVFHFRLSGQPFDCICFRTSQRSSERIKDMFFDIPPCLYRSSKRDVIEDASLHRHIRQCKYMARRCCNQRDFL